MIKVFRIIIIRKGLNFHLFDLMLYYISFEGIKLKISELIVWKRKCIPSLYTKGSCLKGPNIITVLK